MPARLTPTLLFVRPRNAAAFQPVPAPAPPKPDASAAEPPDQKLDGVLIQITTVSCPQALRQA
jgi:hypothetical protein